MLDLASSPGIDTQAYDVYQCAMNLACLCDLLVTAIRKPAEKAWKTLPCVQNWTPACMMSPAGDMLRRIVLVSHWNEDRHHAECLSWYTLGEMAHYKMPMQLIVLVIGQQKDGRQHSHWTKALHHPVGAGPKSINHLRFRRRVGNTKGGFKESWKEIWREDHDEIDRETWLNAMLQDDVLRDLCFTVDMPAMTSSQGQMVRELARRKLDSLHRHRSVAPPIQYSGCHWPVRCGFADCCHSIPPRDPSARLGFLQILPRTPESLEDTHVADKTPLDPCSPELPVPLSPPPEHIS